jgi:hypothetical protein
MPDVPLSRVACAVGLGLFAGAAGTAAMTISSTLEAKLRGRGASSAPSEAAGKVLGVQPRDPDGQARFATVVHWSYGTAWGAARGLMALAGLRGTRAAVAHFATVWGWSLVMLPGLDVTPPAWRQEPRELGVDALHHLVYASATTAAWSALDSTSGA